MATIKIISGNTTTRELTLSDGRHTHEKKGRSITWKIKNPRRSNVGSIELILVTSRADIYSELPNSEDGKEWKAKISKNAPDNAESKYTIFWKAKGGTDTIEDDPKISVKPSLWADFTTLLIGIVSLVAVILTLGLWSKKVKR